MLVRKRDADDLKSLFLDQPIGVLRRFKLLVGPQPMPLDETRVGLDLR
jgi:hypothetical protein